MIYYSDPAVTLYHGDAREILPALERPADHVITDPPYDERTHAGAGSEYRPIGRTRTYSRPLDFAALGSVAVLVPLLSARRWSIAFCSLEMLGAYELATGDRWVRAGFWRRTDGAPQFTGDRPGQPGEGLAIWHPRGRKTWNGGGRSAFFECGVERNNRSHPTQKPEALLGEIVSLFTDPGDLVCDPFAGVGTTLVAAKRLGRRAIGVEMLEAYCERAASRLEQAALPLEYATERLEQGLLEWSTEP